MYLDLDGFKAINDTYGHAYGDDILKMVSQRLLSSSRKEDTVARLGGDEFMVVLGDIHCLADAQGPAAKLVEALSEPYFINDLTLRLSTSIGISIYPDDAESVDALISIADYALYEAKRAGKNRFCSPAANRQSATPMPPAATPAPVAEMAPHR
jgi:diguanylate cyclase (GGDEF)-like protein